MRLRGVAVFVALLGVAATVFLSACGTVPGEPARSAEPPIPDELHGLAVTSVRLGDRDMTVAVADTPEARRRGLMGVADLGPLDGLLFVYDEPVQSAFHMRNVPVPLDIAFFDAGGRALAVLAMSPCATESCPTYRSPGPFRWALETEAGGLAGVEQGAQLVLRPT